MSSQEFPQRVPSLIQNVFGRRTTTLDGAWRTIIDPYEHGYRDYHGQRQTTEGCNEYLGWYDGLPEKADQVIWRTAYEKPVFISEFGADALQGHHGDASTRWTEEFQASVYQHQIAMLRKVPFVRGMSPWILADFRSPRRPLPVIQDYWNRKGLVSDRGIKKQAFSVLQAYYEELARAEGQGVRGP
jgi:hypothetical protein